jgi:hypothetical protein
MKQTLILIFVFTITLYAQVKDNDTKVIWVFSKDSG